MTVNFAKLCGKLCLLVVLFFVILYVNGIPRNLNIFRSVDKETHLEYETNSNFSIPFVNRVFNLNLEYILSNNRICGNRSDVQAVFIVTSYFGNIETRSAMRRAFTGQQLEELKFRRVFLLGEAYDDKYVTQSAIENEHKRYADIIQGNFKEAYRNLTYKHFMGLKWASEFCSNAKFIIKMDDDIVADLRRIPALLTSLKVPRKGELLTGYVLRGMAPIRERQNKWYVTQEEYKYDWYPPFLSGWFYITIPSTAKKIAAMSNYLEYFWIDDLFVTGIVAQRLKIRHFDIGRYFTLHSEFLQCCISDLEKHHYMCDILIGPNGRDNNLFFTFNEAMKICDNTQCVSRKRPLNETCVAEKKNFLGKGNAVIKNYKLH